MAQFMLLLSGYEKEKALKGVAPYGDIIHRYREWMEKLKRENKFHAGDKLRDFEGRRLTLKNGEIVDGPYVETKEGIGSYFVINAKDYDEAVQIAKECPTLSHHRGSIEIREIEI